MLKRLKLVLRTANRRRLDRRSLRKGDGTLRYADWVQAHDTLTPEVLAALQARLAALPVRPLISVLMPVYDPDLGFLQAAIDSVRGQLYPDWQLCIADDASTQPGVRRVLEAAAAADPRVQVRFRTENGHIARASNSALELARGEFVALLDHDDVLPAHALLLNAEAIVHLPGTKLLYSDEDMLRYDGQRQWPNFKPDWNPELFRAQNMVCHLGVYDTALVRRLGGFRVGFEGAQDYDITARCVDALAPEQIVHIPHVLYHWRSHEDSSAAGSEVKPYIVEAGRRALHEHLQRAGVRAEVAPTAGGGYRVRLPLPSPPPRVSVVVVPHGDAVAAARCAQAVQAGGASAALQVLVAGPSLADTLQQADGALLCLLDARVAAPLPRHALDELAALALRPGTGAVAPRLLRPDGTVQSTGLVLGAGGLAAPAHQGAVRSSHGYRSRAVLNQNMSALGPECLVIERSRFQAAGGLDAGLASLPAQVIELCLRLQRAGQRNVVAAGVELTVAHATIAPMPAADADLLRSRWGAWLHHDPAYNPNLNLATADFALAPAPRVTLARPWFESLAAPAAGRGGRP